MTKLKLMTLTAFIGTCVQAKDCGIAPSGYSFGANCAMNKSVPAARQEAAPIAKDALMDKSRWEEIRLTMKSGKPGYVAAVGVGFALSLDAILMNETVTEDVDRFFIRTDPGSHRTCQANGLQQSIGYTLFKVKNCR